MCVHDHKIGISNMMYRKLILYLSSSEVIYIINMHIVLRYFSLKNPLIVMSNKTYASTVVIACGCVGMMVPPLINRLTWSRGAGISWSPDGI